MKMQAVASSDLPDAGPGGMVVGIATTNSRQGLPLHVEIEPGEGGPDETSYAKGEDVRAVAVEGMVRRFGSTSPEVLDRIRRTLRYVLEL